MIILHARSALIDLLFLENGVDGYSCLVAGGGVVQAWQLTGFKSSSCWHNTPYWLRLSDITPSGSCTVHG